jgi:hypothetical protein
LDTGKEWWSLIHSQWRNPKTGKLKPHKFFPRIVIKALNSKSSIIHSTRPPLFEPRTEDEKVKHWPGARFLDPRTLLWALRNRSYSLESACKELQNRTSEDRSPTYGKVTLEEIEYARGDVACTVDLLNAVKQEFDLHSIAFRSGPNVQLCKSGEKLSGRTQYFASQREVMNADKAYGICLQTYFGGRAESRIRNWEVPVCPVDFTSQYPKSENFFRRSLLNAALTEHSGQDLSSSVSFIPTTTYFQCARSTTAQLKI